ncbi:hypothetical protein ACJ73_02127 [Blastomyces percursus]|uniref:Uncharacterized protein n=1 Tax=Blastomyces percursus TaxID=1658174 RepID=A0A1J9RD43_9EURO|nr:hypothetical protein ACJ73_02127 [Blastomyces percursus]
MHPLTPNIHKKNPQQQKRNNQKKKHTNYTKVPKHMRHRSPLITTTYQGLSSKLHLHRTKEERSHRKDEQNMAVESVEVGTVLRPLPFIAGAVEKNFE